MKTTNATKKSIPPGFRFAEVGETLRPSAMFWNRYSGKWQPSAAVSQPGLGALRCNSPKSYIVPKDNK